MDRRLPPSFRSSATTDASPHRERLSHHHQERLNRSHNRPWAGAGTDSPSRSHQYSSLRSHSPSSFGRAPSPLPLSYTGSGAVSNTPATTTTPSNSSNSSSSNNPRTANPYNGMDTTTTIDGSRGSVAAGLSSYERYRSLRLQTTPTTSSSSTTNNYLSSSSSTAAKVTAASPSAAARRRGSLSPSSRRFANSSAGTGGTSTAPSAGTSTAPSSSASSTAVPSVTTAATRSSSPRDLRKQRLSQQYSASGRSSPYRPAQSSSSSTNTTTTTTPSGRSSPFLPPSMMTTTNPTTTNPLHQPLQPPPPLVVDPPTTTTAAEGGSSPHAMPVSTTSASSSRGSYRKSLGDRASATAEPPLGGLKSPKTKKASSSSTTTKSKSMTKSEEEEEPPAPSSKSNKASSSSSHKPRSSRHRKSITATTTSDESDDEGVGGGGRSSTVRKSKKKSPKSSSSSKPKRSSTKKTSTTTPPLESSGDDDENVSSDEDHHPATSTKGTMAPPTTITTTTTTTTMSASSPTTVESKPRVPPSILSPISATMRARGGVPSSPSRRDATTAGAVSSPGVVPPKDETPSTTHAAVRGWSTYRNRPKLTGNPDGSTPTTTTSASTPTTATTTTTAPRQPRTNPFGSSSETSKVSQYLNMRKSITSSSFTAASSQSPPLAKPHAISSDREAAISALRQKSISNETDVTLSSGSLTTTNPTANHMFSGSASEGTTDDDDEDDGDDSTSSSSDEDDEVAAAGGEIAEWSVRVCVVSAVDLPSNVVPTVPFSPVLKVGLVRLQNPNKPSSQQLPPADSLEEPSQLTTKAKSVPNPPNTIPPELKNKLYESGLTSVSKARVRSTGAKIMSKRDNGSVEFHEEMRWDATQPPEQMAFCIELSARAVMTPSNHKESPYEQVVKALDFPGASRHSASRGEGGGSADSNDKTGRLKSLFRRGGGSGGADTNKRSEMELANAAAVVAKHLVEGEEAKTGGGTAEDDDGPHPPTDSRGSRTSLGSSSMTSNNPSTSEINVQLLSRRKRRKPRMTNDIRLGSQIIPISKLAWRKALNNNEAARIEQWFELETAAGGSPTKPGAKSSRNPSVLLEISFSAPDVLDESEDEIEEEEGEEGPSARDSKRVASFSRRASKSIRAQLLKEVQLGEVKHNKEEEPMLEPGVVDHVCVVGPLNIGDQKSDDGASGWVNTTPDCGVLEQFPKIGYHAENGRNVALPDKVEWFCFPEGCRLWRGTTPPNAEELNLVRFSASSPANIATTIASFDACLGCTTSFSWFVLASNSDEYGSANTKTFGACIRFFVPAPTGIDPTQDDFGQSIRGAALYDKASKRLWVPMALCMTSHLPIVGAMEVMLLRMCEALSAMMAEQGKEEGLRYFFEDVASLALNYQRPIPGVVNCSIPFLNGDRLTLSLPHVTGLPSLPHGASVTSACRLLQANGINYILAAMLTECKILIHSDDISNLCLVAEVMTALMYPFQWSLPYIPVLPVPMMEFIEAPLSYLLGLPSSSMRLVNPEFLEDVVVIDLDNDFSGASGHVDDVRESNTKTPTPLPASTALNVQKAVYRLLQKSDDNEDDDNPAGNFPPTRSFPRMEAETQVEREFRISIALEIASLVRGYQDCLITGTSAQPMFNVDKFLQSAPILFDEQRGTSLTSSSGLRVLSPRSRRFISILVTCQHFHQFLDAAESESLSFFREVMTELEAYGSKRDLLAVKRVLSLDAQKTIDQLNSILKRVEDKVPIYKVKKSGSERPTEDSPLSDSLDFPYSLLRPIIMGDENTQSQSGGTEGVHKISLEYLVELEKNPWRYQSFLSIDLDQTKDSGVVVVAEKVKLRDAIGERRYHLWKNSMERMDDEDGSLVSDEPAANQTLDLTALLAENGEDGVAAENNSTEEHPADAAKRRIADAKDRDSLRRCLEQARVAGGSAVEATSDPSRDLVAEAETALQNASARRFLLAILQKRGSHESADSQRSKRKQSSGASKLEAGAFEVLLRLGCAMLDACLEDRDYDSAYALLKLTAGLYSTVGDDESPTVLYMTQRLGHHPIYADLGVWLRAKKMHLSAAAADEKDNDDVAADDAETDEYEAAVATLYEMLGYDIPAEELARFASRVSEENGWFRSERGQSLLLLARRICMRRDTGSANSSQRTTSDIEMMSPTSAHRERDGESATAEEGAAPTKESTSDAEESWSEIGWVHPSAQYSSRFEKDAKRRSTGRNALRNRHMKRSAVTSMAYLGSSVVVTGALDGGVFLARNAQNSSASEEGNGVGVKGIHLDWGSAGSRYSAQSPSTATDGSYGVGAVSILAATQPANQSYDALQMKPGPSRKSVTDQLDEEELLNAMEGCRVVAGTTCGDLRVWSVKDVLSAVFYALRGNEIGNIGIGDDRTTHRGGEGVSSSSIGSRRGSRVDFAAGSSLTRLKFSLRGRALSGHRGGVSCVDVPSHVYRPDSIISGGADGLIKLWSLRAPGSIGRRAEAETPTRGSVNALEDLSPRNKATRSGDAMSILAGHGGRVLCVKTAWHGDRLLSGGADRTVRLWDLGGSGGKCLNSLSGHFGWVTSVKYWGPNTIISASTDRSIALWDARVRNAPLFALRHHYAPISDILVGARTDPIMISAGGDGTIAAWDFRRLSDAASQSPSSKDRQCKVIRRPAGKLYLHDFSSWRRTYGPVLLSRGPSSRTKTVRCLGRDAILREWDIRTGEVVSEHVTGHCDTISTFASLDGDKLHDSQIETSGKHAGDGTITTSWDGTVRVRRLNRN